ncbi:MAG: autotransporter-associated beta strand repeat-containing protein, partial [Planctomycetes bacterium]|nr:autotransporter-associated beta strand repeat-containing protein [Planctomycetota bacterium]
MRLGAEDFGTTKSYDASAADGGDSDDHKLNDAGTEITVTGDGTYAYTLDGVISGTGDLLKTGTGTLVLGKSFNTYTGGTIVTDGKLRIADSGSINRDSYISVTGAGTKLESQAVVAVGAFGRGIMDVLDGASVVAASGGTFGSSAGSSGTVMVSGNGSKLRFNGIVYIGSNGKGIMNITKGATVAVSNILNVGNDSASTGTVLMSGSKTALSVGGSLKVGVSGTALLSISNTATIETNGLEIGTNSESTGVISVNGNQSSLTSSNYVTVGSLGAGTLNITDGATVTGSTIYLAFSPGSTGTVTVGGSESTLNASGDITVGRGGTGLLAGTGTVISNNSGVAGSVLVYTRGTLSAGDHDGEIGILKIGDSATSQKTNVTVNNGAKLRVDGKGTNADRIDIYGDAVVGVSSSGITVDLGSLNDIAGAAVLTVSDTLTTSPSILANTNFTLNGVELTALGSRVTSSSATLAQSLDGKSLKLTTAFSAQSSQLTWTGSADPTTWDMVTDNNWTNSGGTVKQFLAGDWVTFDSTGAGSEIDIASGGVTASRMDVSGGTWIFNGNIVVHQDAWVD